MKLMFIIAGGIVFGILLPTTGCGNGGQKVAEIPPTDLLLAREIMARSVEQYENCSAYRDHGIMTRTFDGEKGREQIDTTFTTVFERPYRFRFECQEDDNRYIIYADAAAVRAWWGEAEGIQPMTSLDEAIGRAVGPSNGASHTIPRLLMPDRVRGRSLAELSDMKRLADALLGETPCYRLGGDDRTGAPYVVWIDRETFMVRRIDETHAFEGFGTTDTTIYHPELNPELKDDEFFLKTPGAASPPGEMTARLSRLGG